MINLSKRLQAIAKYIPDGAIFADIGSDHAYLCSSICLTDPLARAIAVEVRPGPFEAAKSTIYKYELQNRIDIRLGDGLDVIDDSDNIDTVVIAGMGGKLITDIINKNIDKIRNIKRCIFQPNTNAELIRELVYNLNVSLMHEEIIEDNHRIYEVLIFDQDANTDSYNPSISLEKQLYLGPILMKENSMVFQKKWKKELEHTKKIIRQLENRHILHDDKFSLLKKRSAWMEEIFK